jgi:uncharacterized protein
MKLHQLDPARHNLVTGYGAGYIAVNNVRHATNVLVSPLGVSAWPVTDFARLEAGDFAFVAEMKPEILILGTGAVQRFPPPALARALAGAGAGVEIMDSRAACRTYNILAAEGRKVVAAILLEPGSA